MGSKALAVLAYPRLHVGLLDLGHATSRKYGGAGFSIGGPASRLSATPSDRLSLIGFENLDLRGQEEIRTVLGRLADFGGLDLPLTLRLDAVAPQHIGLGTKTAICLATVVVVCRSLGLKLSEKDAQRLSGRGGTSGVGIHAFFHGGFVLDLGRPTDDEPFAPSSSVIPDTIPILSTRVAIPENWRFALLLPAGIRLSGSAERSFFAKNTPIDPSEVYKAIALLYHDILPSVIQGDLRTLSSALTAFHLSGFKHHELLAQDGTVRELVLELQARKVGAVGMSSLGPLVYVIVDESDRRALRTIEEVCRSRKIRDLGLVAGNNSSHIIAPC